MKFYLYASSKNKKFYRAPALVKTIDADDVVAARDAAALVANSHHQVIYGYATPPVDAESIDAFSADIVCRPAR